MIRKALALIDRGSITLSEMAMDLDMSEADLKNRLEMMVMMGHLEAVTIPADTTDAEADCPGCIMSSRCREDECSDGVPVVGYRLTDKGKRMAQGMEG